MKNLKLSSEKGKFLLNIETKSPRISESFCICFPYNSIVLNYQYNNEKNEYSIITNEFVSLSKQSVSNLKFPKVNSDLINSKSNRLETFDSTIV